MPLRDHFRPPVDEDLPWSTLYAGWASNLVEDLNENRLPDGFIAAERTYAGRIPEIDIAAWEKHSVPGPTGGNGTATLAVTAAVVAPDFTGVLKDNAVEETTIHIYAKRRTLVAVIELVSPSNKDRPSERERFARKVASHLLSGVAVAVVDVVTTMHFNLHDAVAAVLAWSDDCKMPGTPTTYAVSYGPKMSDEHILADVWLRELAVGRPIPSIPLRHKTDVYVPLELEQTYVTACRKRGLI